MSNPVYDLAIVGGGIGGSALAHAMARDGLRVLVVEREKAFKDRVRGEGMHAWGVPEAKALGIYDEVMKNRGVEVCWWDIYLGSEPFAHRDFTTTTTHQSPLVSFYHPEMQSALLDSASKVGAEIWRGASVKGIGPGPRPSLTVARSDWVEEVEARLIVGADGRNSATRKWGGFDIHQDPEQRLFTGVLLEGPDVPEDTWIAHMNPDNGHEAMLCNIGGGRIRAYLGHPRSAKRRIAKPQDFPRFVAGCGDAGAPVELYEAARLLGPMASFGADDIWVPHPFKGGIALIGDAASTCDPSFGQGLALTLRSVRLLRDCLLTHDDWTAAGEAYAQAQQAEFMKVRRLEDWYRCMFLETGPEADQRRAHALPLIAEDASRVPDLFGMGPDAACDEVARKRFFGEDRPRAAT